MTAIEEALYHDGRVHCVCAFELSVEELRLTLHPIWREQVLTEAVFLKPRNVVKDDSYVSEDERELPLGIIGFDSENFRMAAGASACTRMVANMGLIRTGR